MASLNDKTLTLTRIHNPFNRVDRDEVCYEYRGETLSAIRETLPGEIDFAVALNGQVVPAEQFGLVVPQPGDHLTFLPIPAGGNNGKQVGRIVGMLAIAALSIWTAGAATAALGGANAAGLFGLTAAQTGMLAGAAASMVGGILVGAVFAPKSPVADLGSNAYSWSPVTLQRQGIPMPKYYGTILITGNIISGYIDSDGAKQRMNVLISLGMGPFKGISPETLMLNTQPIGNFKEVSATVRLGQLDQEPIPDFDAVRTDFPQTVKVVYGSPYTYVTTGNSFDSLVVEVGFPAGLYKTMNDGSRDPLQVQFKIEVALHGTDAWKCISQTPNAPISRPQPAHWSKGYWTGQGGNHWIEVEAGSSNPADHKEGEFVSTRYNDYQWHWLTDGVTVSTGVADYVTVTGNSPTPLKFSYPAKNLPHGRYDVRVTRISSDYDASYMIGDLYLANVREVVDAQLTYPRQVLVALKALTTDQLSGSMQFSTIPDCALVRVWNGSVWSVEFSKNPAWVLWDVLTQPVFDNDLNVIRYDGIDPARLDLPKFAELADWCDVLVPDGEGGTEKRITFNGGFDTEDNLWAAAQAVCAVAGCSLVPTGTGYTLAIEKPATPVGLFSVGNIGLDSFQETFLSMEDRAAEIEVDFLDRDQGYQRRPISIINPDIPTVTNKVAVQALGVTGASEAARLANRQLRVNQLITRTIRITAEIDAIACTVGDVTNIQHDVPQWGFGGRIVAASTNTVQLDQQVTLKPGGLYSVMVRLADDSIVTRAIVNTATTTDTLTVATPFVQVPAEYDVYAFGESTKVVKPFRVLTIQRSGDLQATITAAEYNESVYDDSGASAIATRNYSSLPTIVEVTGLTLAEQASIDESGVIRRSILASWSTGDRAIADHFDVYCRAVGTPWQFAGQTRDLGYSIAGVDPVTTYQVTVLGVDAAGGHVPFSAAPSEQITTSSTSDAMGTNLMAGVTGLQIFGQANDTEFVGKDCRLIWNKVAAVDQDAPAGEETNGAGSSIPDLWFKDYELKILDLDGKLRRTEYLPAETYTYAFDKNYDDGRGVPVRSFAIEVRARDRYFRVSAVPAKLTVSNPAPPAVDSVTLTPFIGAFNVSFQSPGTPDIAGFLVHGVPAAGLSGGDFVPAENNLLYKGTATGALIDSFAGAKLSAGTWCVKVAAYDSFGTDALTWSPLSTVTVQSAAQDILDLLTGQITASQLNADLSAKMDSVDELMAQYDNIADAAASAVSAATSASAAIAAETAAVQARNAAEGSATSAQESAAGASTSSANASGYADAANVSATSAATSAGSAGEAALAASNSATAAQISAQDSADSAEAAATSSDSAAAYRTDAETAATSANSSAVTATAARDAAQGSASAASTYASNASASATAAGTSASAAAVSATTASTKAGNASTSASAAAVSASDAQTAATNASTSATNAATKATAASTSATSAATSASAAAGSASAASGSANTASTSAGQAATSATSAATSAANAQTAATSASTYASNAQGYAATCTSAVSTVNAAVGTISAQYTIKIDANGNVAGIGLYSDSTTGSVIQILANKFAIVDPANPTASVLPFVVSEGVVYINSAMIGNLDAGKITTGTLTGRTIQTASSGQRFVVDTSSNLACFYDATGARQVAIGINSYGDAGSYLAFLGGVIGGSTQQGIYVGMTGGRAAVFKSTTSDYAVVITGGYSTNGTCGGLSVNALWGGPGITAGSNRGIGIDASSGTSIAVRGTSASSTGVQGTGGTLGGIFDCGSLGNVCLTPSPSGVYPTHVAAKGTIYCNLYGGLDLFLNYNGSTGWTRFYFFAPGE